MKLSKQQESELLKAYNRWWHSYLNGDIETYDSFFDDEYHFVGSTDGEEYLDRENTTAFLRATANQLAGKAELRNLQRAIETLDEGLVLITDLADAYVLSEGEWVYYSRFRFSSLMRNGKKGWQFVYQHFSAPDTKAEEGETLGVAQISRENQELRDAIKRRTKELEIKNKELETEAALERVRAAMMEMQKSEALKQVIGIIFRQLQLLGFDAPACSLILYNEDLSAEHWLTGYSHDEYPRSYKIPYVDHPYFTDLLQAWQQKVNYGEFVFEGKKKLEYADWLLKYSEFSLLPDEFKTMMRSPEKTFCSDAFMRYGMVEIIGTNPLPEPKIDILKRFAQVFEQTYTRFLDLKKAEVQAKEAMIEMALEKVRSRTMGMQKSEELKEVIQVIYDQFTDLKIHIEHTGFIVDYKTNDAMHIWLADLHGAPSEITLPYFDCAHWNSFIEARDKGLDFFANKLDFEEKNAFYKDLFELVPGLPEEAMESYLNARGLAISTVLLDNVGLYIENFDGIPYTDEENDVLMRFGKVFQQAYTRFNDLQKAEAQSREAHIEAALERVRSKTMAMHKSEQLAETALVLYEQFELLGNIPDRMSIGIFRQESNEVDLWPTDRSGQLFSRRFTGPVDGTPAMAKIVKAWKSGNESIVIDLSGPKLDHWMKYIREVMGLYIDDSQMQGRRVQQAAFFSHGMLLLTTNNPIPDENLQLLNRFAKVFSQTYTRFLDLQKAETQAREAQIEAALERVRAASMAMHASNELSKVITILGEQLHQLGIEMDAAILNEKVEGSKDWHMWLAIPSGSKELYTRVEQVRVPYKRMAAFDRIYRSDSQGLYVFSDYHNKAQKDLFFRHYFKNSNHLDVPKARKDYIFSCPGLSRTTILSKNSFIQYFRYSKEVFSTEDKQVLERFGHVFEQSYTRFLDLQKAEAQAREAQIEAALERVRSKTMAMHNSQDVGETVVTLFDEVLHLGLDKSIRCGIGILQGNNRMETWSATYDAQNKVDLVMGTLDMTIHPLLMGTLKAWKNKEPDHSYELVGEEVIKYYRGLNNEPDYPFQVDLATLPERIYNRSFYFSEGLLFSFTSNPLTEEAAGVLRRFAGVFGQTYRRYLDLKKAEEQAREAQIEAALERIRARALAMHNSDELADVANVLREQMGLLNQPELETSSIQLYHRGTKTIESWFAFRLPGKTKGKFQSGTVHIPFESSLVSQKWANLFYSKKTEYTIRIAGQELQEWLAVREKGTPEANYGKGEPPSVLYAHFSKFSGGALVMVTLAEPTENSKLLQKRAAVVFDLAYKRFRDLQKSEAQAVEAIKQASVDRVRGEISGMRSTADLERITPLIWRELTTLGVPFFRCGVFIVDDADKHVNVYLSAPDGHSLGAMRFVFDANTLTSKIVAHWRKGKIYKEHWSQQDFIAWTKDLKSQNQIQDERTYQDSDTPPESLHLHFIPFKQGMLYVGNAQKLEANEIGLVQSLAAAFEMAYARYEDFIRLEKAKSGIEAALGELKATQAQLIQSEKMASLGELTAGIAHEIQNPLNFVNNFSELNAELLEELGQEIEAGNMEEVKALAGDIKQNEVKISHHGKRAESIVKGMLQHSRSSSGVKELADINVLCDEYLRLSYHGLRAKDKSFNADFKVDFEEALPKVKIVPQDIGRVLLNLINNAFYAVDKKAKAGEGNFKPEVLIVTRKQGAAIEIKVMDNGDGISKGMREKIFQPFFTTKPTGQGTGLGLSLSYDIVKAHGGDLRMNTREGMGSEFIIQLPVTNNS